MEEREIRRGDIYYADLSPVVGSEQGGIRPVLVIQNNTGNAYSPTVIVAAVTSKPKTKLPTHVILRDRKGLILSILVDTFSSRIFPYAASFNES